MALGRFAPLSVGADGKTARAWAELVSANAQQWESVWRWARGMGNLIALVLRQSLRRIVPGLVAGSVLGLAAARIIGGMLVSVSPSDPLAFSSAAAFLGLVAALAS